MEVVRAERAGFCMGVDLALRKLNKVLDDPAPPGPVYNLGSIIHNPQVISGYAARGVVTVNSPAEIPAGASVVIRAHGVPREVHHVLEGGGVNVVDGTCPKVQEACRLIDRKTRDGRKLLLYGEAAHPEVKCLVSHAAAGSIVFDSLKKCEDLELDSDAKYCLAAQTTQDKEIFDIIVKSFENRKALDITLLETICDATKKRQEEAIRIAGDVDYVVVVGGYGSSNTRRLAQVVNAQGTKAVHVERPDELPLNELKQCRKVGLAAGASTPKNIVDEIHHLLEDLS